MRGRSEAGAALVALLLALGVPGPARGASAESVGETLSGFDDEEDDADTAQQDDLSGFDDEDGEAPRESAPIAGDQPVGDEATPFWHLAGDLSVGSSYNYLEHHSATGTPYGNLSRLRTQLDLQLDLRLPDGWKARIEGYGFYDFSYVLKGRDQYTNDVIDDYEWEVDFREVWVQGSPLESVDLKLGRQIVNWGRSDTVRVLDIVNPLDNREPGLVDIEDLRLPLTMARVDYYPGWVPDRFGDWDVQLLVIPEFRQDRNPSIGNDFNPIDPAALPIPLPNPDTPHQFGSAPEYGASLGGVFSGWDLSLYAARVYQNTRFVTGGLKGDSHITMAGAGGNVTFGSWLLKAEIAYLYGIEYAVETPAPPFLLSRDKARLDSMAGVEYYGFDDAQIALEVVDRHIFGFQSGQKPFQQQDSLESALRVTLDFLNDRLHTTAVGLMLGSHAEDGSVVRVEASFDLRDALTLGGGIVLYQKGDTVAFEDIGPNDRFFVRLEYSF